MEPLLPRQEACYKAMIAFQENGFQVTPRSIAKELGYSTATFDGQGMAYQDFVNLEAKGWVKIKSSGGYRTYWALPKP